MNIDENAQQDILEEITTLKVKDPRISWDKITTALNKKLQRKYTIYDYKRLFRKNTYKGQGACFHFSA